MLRLFPLLFGILLLAPTLRAGTGVKTSRPGVLHLTLEEAVQMALARNFSIQVQRFEPRIARENITSELGRFDPTLDLSATRSEITRNNLATADGRDDGRSVTRVDNIGSGVSGLTPLGTTYDLGLGSRNSTGSPAAFRSDYRSNARLGLTQPLLRGFGPNATLSQVRIARNNAVASEWQLRQRIIDVVTDTNYVFNDLYLAHENLAVAQRSRELARQLLADNRRRAEIGVMSPLDITTARAEVASREEGVILAEREIKNTENLLKQLTTDDTFAMLGVLVEIEPPPVPLFSADVRAGIRDALELRPDYRQSILDLQRREIRLAFAKNQALPRLDLTTSLNLLGNDTDFGTSFSRAGQRDETEWTAGAIFSLPIPNRTARGNVNAARLSSTQALVELQRLEQQIIVQVDNASGLIVTARQRIASTSEARVLARESLEAGQERLRAGTGTTFEVLELQRRLSETEFAEARARADYNRAVGEYHRQTGTTLRAHALLLN
jgi:outer membrane protein TolC